MKVSAWLCKTCILGLLFAQTVGSSLETLPIVQGWTDSTTTQFSILGFKADRLSFRVTSSRGQYHWPVRQEMHVGVGPSDAAIFQVAFAGLSPRIDYRLEVIGQNGQLVDARHFSTLDLNEQGGRIALASCMFDKLHNPHAWRQMERVGPDAIFFLGDAAYLDHVGLLKRRVPDESQLWQRHVETRQTLAVFYWPRLVPVFAIPDDHDYGYNNAGAEFHLKEESARLFRAFFPRWKAGGSFKEGPGLSFRLSALWGADFLFLDGRTFRDFSRAENGLLGREQEEWLLESLSRERPAALVSGTQFFGGYLKKDSYEFHAPRDFKRFVERLKQSGTRLSFISGDIHFSEAMVVLDLGYPTIEITSSSIHSSTLPGRHIFQRHNPRRLVATSTHNFALLELFDQGHQVDFRNRFIGWRGQNLGEVVFTHPK